MRAKYSDYERIVYGYLSNYHMLRGQIDGITKEIETLTEQIKALYDAKTTHYGVDTGGGYDELASSERKFARKQELDAKLYNAQVNLQNVALAVWRVDNAINYLADVPRKIIEERFFERKSLLQVSIDVGYSERSCYRMLRRAITEMTRIIFPEAEGQKNIEFVFLNGIMPGGE